ncbi:MAG: hypothetical protein RR902_01895 [Oscillospiraceae bacterium]
MQQKEEQRCRCCGEVLCDDDIVYVNEEGLIMGCAGCLHEEYLQDTGAEEYD